MEQNSPVEAFLSKVGLTAHRDAFDADLYTLGWDGEVVATETVAKLFTLATVAALMRQAGIPASTTTFIVNKLNLRPVEALSSQDIVVFMDMRVVAIPADNDAGFTAVQVNNLRPVTQEQLDEAAAITVQQTTFTVPNVWRSVESFLISLPKTPMDVQS